VLSAIGLLIGGVGVMNIMLVSVTERTRNRSTQSDWAKRSDITWQFLLEAMTLTASGGLSRWCWLTGWCCSFVSRCNGRIVSPVGGDCGRGRKRNRRVDLRCVAAMKAANSIRWKLCGTNSQSLLHSRASDVD